MAIDIAWPCRRPSVHFKSRDELQTKGKGTLYASLCDKLEMSSRHILAEFALHICIYQIWVDFPLGQTLHPHPPAWRSPHPLFGKIWMVPPNKFKLCVANRSNLFWGISVPKILGLLESSDVFLGVDLLQNSHDAQKSKILKPYFSARVQVPLCRTRVSVVLISGAPGELRNRFTIQNAWLDSGRPRVL